MKNYHKHISIVLAVFMLICGIGWSVAQTDSLFVYHQVDYLHSIADSVDGFVDSAPAVLSGTKGVHMEQTLNRVTAYRSHSGTGDSTYTLFYYILQYLFHSKRLVRDAFAEGDAVGLFCSSLVVKYVHSTDGEKGRLRS